MTSVQRMAELADAKAAALKKNKPRKGGDRKKSGQEKAPVPPPAGVGRPKGPDVKKLVLALAPGLVERIDKWRFAQEIGTRTDAIRELLERGLKP